MPQRRFTRMVEGVEHEVLVGWDRPTRSFFLTVYAYPDPQDQDKAREFLQKNENFYEDNIVFSSLYLPDGKISLDGIEQQLILHKIMPPKDLMRDLKMDCATGIYFDVYVYTD